jgi:quinol monooxygenase YgiN
MYRYLSAFLFITAFAAFNVDAQTPPIDGPVYIATYIEINPARVDEARTMLRQYRDDGRNGAGNLRMELVQEAGRPARFALMEIWADQRAFDAFGKAANAVRLRTMVKAVSAAPSDERVHNGLSVAARDVESAGSVVVLTHVDVPGALKDTVIPMLRELSDASRKEAGNLRFEIQQQGNRPNHFTMVERWTDHSAQERHVLAAHTRQFRDKLGPMVGALYDERLFRVVD